ncbi:MAG: hypothetical protein EG823_07035 [Actinobacteria bacterium]|nr:hypothetical protein [Actinomycetota bacterium]
MFAKLRDDRGAVAVTVALLLFVLLLLSALVVDMGYWYNVRRQLQSAADAGALAGCRELASGGSNNDIWDAVTAYAGANAVTPVDNITVIEPSPGGLSDIGDDFVKVTVSSDAVGFFSRIVGMDSNVIQAQAKARLDYLVGARTPVPWALPILQVTRMFADVNGVEHAMSEGTDDHWSGWLPSGSTGTVGVTAYNDQTLDPNYPDGVPEEISPVQRLVYLPAGSRFADVRMPQQTFTSGAGENVRIYIDLTGPLGPGESVQVTFDKKKYAAAGLGGNSYSASFKAPTTDRLWSTASVTVAIVQGNKVVEALPGEPIIVIRRSTYPIKAIEVHPFVFRAGASAPIQVEVELNSYEKNKLYELKVIGGGGETGNYMAIDFHTLRHPPNWRHPQDPAEYPDMPGSTNLYYDYIAGTADYDFIMHVDDTVWTEPGNKSGPKTRTALQTRFAGEPADFQGWLKDRKASNRLVFIPITEKIQKTTGQTPLRVISFAVMYVEDVDTSGGGALVRGYFVDYAGPGWIVSPDPPNSPLIARAPHLVAEGVDF